MNAPLRRSGSYIDMHRIGKALAGMVVCRNFKQPFILIKIATQNAQDRFTFFYAKTAGKMFRGGDRLNVLRDLGDFYLSKILKLAEDGCLRHIDFLDRSGKVRMYPGNGDRDRVLGMLTNGNVVVR